MVKGRGLLYLVLAVWVDLSWAQVSTGSADNLSLVICPDVPCQNGGVCEDGYCACPSVEDPRNGGVETWQYYGDFCEVLNPCFEEVNPCHNGGSCNAFFDDDRNFICDCTGRWSGPNCLSEDLCYDVNCQNGGWCEENRGCWCQDGWYGVECEFHDLCYAVTCGEFGFCDETTGSCICYNGYYGEGCLFDDLCWEVECHHGGTCSQETGFCDCVDGYFGELCDERDSCQTDDGEVDCLNGGYCDSSSNDHFVCICAPGWYGEYCELEDFCYHVECNEGDCLFGTCICHEGFFGEFCENAVNVNDPCDPNPCQYQGSCASDETSITGYTCECVPGTTGLTCEIIEAVANCDNEPCHHGTCVMDENADTGLGFYCICNEGYWGTWCGHMIEGYESSSPSGSASFSSSPTGSSSSVPMPPMCEDYPAAPDRSVSLTMRDISNMTSMLAEDISALGPCYQMLRTRVIGRLGFSRELITDGPIIQAFLDDLETNPSSAQAFSEDWRITFRDAFTDCEDASCIVTELCGVFSEDTFSSEQDVSEQTVDRLRSACRDESWRFSDFIANQSLEGVCEFSFVPLAFAETCNCP